VKEKVEDRILTQ